MKPRTSPHPRLQSPRKPSKKRHSNSGKTQKTKPGTESTQVKLKPVPWPDIIPAGQWANYRSAIEAARNAGLPFLLGGGFALATYTGRWRNTKDIDFYILPRDREAMIAALSSIGFVDYYDQRPYDPGWIYRSTREGIIVDIIWSMANRRAEVDQLWFDRAQSVKVRDESIQVAPPEEILWCKLYIMQRDHCDWTDIFNLIYVAGRQLNWEHLIQRVGIDLPLLRAALTMFDWLCPNTSVQLPDRLRKQLELPKPKRISTTEEQHRIRLLDSRAWFAALQPDDQNLEV